MQNEKRQSVANTHKITPSIIHKSFPRGSAVKNLPAIQETQVLSLGGEDSLEKEIGTHSSILALEIPWTGESGGLQSMVLQEFNTT